MRKELEQIKQSANSLGTSEQVFEVRRELVRLQGENRRLTTENEMLRNYSAKPIHSERESKAETLVLELKEQIMRKDNELTALLARAKQL